MGVPQKFQSTHSHGVRRKIYGIKIGGRNFNPRTHTECDCDLYSPSTENSYFNPRTHTECDGVAIDLILGLINFNPRTHTECDHLQFC